MWEASNCQAGLENKAEFAQGMYAAMMYFCECVLNSKAPEKGTLEFGLKMMKVYEAALLSDGKTLRLD